jgi:hypothetical protein
MKKHFIYTLIALLILNIGSAQDFMEGKKAAATIAEKTKSGNYKDIFASFFQLAANQLTGEEKTIDFNATLFELRSKVNPDLKRDVNYIKETFYRNFQFNFKLNLNEDFDYQGFTGGFTYAAYNGRDKSVAKFGNDFDFMFTEFNNGLQKAQAAVIKKIVMDASLSPEEKSAKIKDFNDNVVRPYLNKKDVTSTDPQLVNDFTAALTNEKLNFVQNGKKYSDYKELLDGIHAYMDDFYKELEGKPLLTIAADGTSNTEGKFNKASCGIVFLQGIKGTGSEIDLKAKFIYADTLQTEHLPRTAFNAKGGLNFKIGKDSQKQSYFEVKAEFEYNKIFKNLMPDEEEKMISGNAEVRVRIAKDLWIPLVVKYDIENSNFLGFLNVTYNFGD